MNVFAATQPIFDRKLKVIAYELLYRDGTFKNEYSSDNANAASSRVISNLFEQTGRNRITGDKRVFINFTEDLLLHDIAFFCPKEDLVVEILETVNPSPEIIEKCCQLKQAGYTIALDDFVDDKSWQPLVELCDIIKIDFLNTKPSKIAKLVSKYGKKKQLLAEKVEDNADFAKAFSLGFTYFQGYFFSKPQMFSKKDIAPLKGSYFQLLKMCNDKHINIRDIGGVISNDISLTLKLLRLVNSCAFPHRVKITSVQMALSYIGEVMIRRWVSLITLTGLNSDKPSELMRLSLIRAKFGEIIAESCNPPQDGNDLFLLGMFSLLDIAIEADFVTILSDLAVSESVKEALINKKGVLADFLKFYYDYEHADWDEIKNFLIKYGMGESETSAALTQAMVWYNEFESDITD